MIRGQGVVRFGVGVVPGPRDGAGGGGVDRWHEGVGQRLAGANRSEQWLLEQASKIVDEATAVDARRTPSSVMRSVMNCLRSWPGVLVGGADPCGVSRG